MLTIESLYSELFSFLFNFYTLFIILFPLVLSVMVERFYLPGMLNQVKSRPGNLLSFCVKFKNIAYGVSFFLYLGAPVLGMLASLPLILAIILIYLAWFLYIIGLTIFINKYFKVKYSFSISWIDYIFSLFWSICFLFSSLALINLISSRDFGSILEDHVLYLVVFLVFTIGGLALIISYKGLRSLTLGFVIASIIMSILSMLYIFIGLSFSRVPNDMISPVFICGLLLIFLPIFIPVLTFRNSQ